MGPCLCICPRTSGRRKQGKAAGITGDCVSHNAVACRISSLQKELYAASGQAVNHSAFGAVLGLCAVGQCRGMFPGSFGRRKNKFDDRRKVLQHRNS